MTDVIRAGPDAGAAPSSGVRFAFYGRVSTEDQQDPEASRAWQLRRAEGVIAGHGEVVAEFFDVGVSRSEPWRERPEAAALLAEMKRRDRRFDAVVVGEPQRAFYGNQYGLTFPVFEHWRCALWVPEVGGRVDPESEAADMLMSIFGGMSKGERMRIRTRVRAAMDSQAATEGRWLGGRPPYGFTLVDIGPHPHPGKARDGKRLRQLAPDPVTAPIVATLFDLYVREQFGYRQIAQRLTDDGVPSPSAYDPDRNPHRAGAHGAWNLMSVRAILSNPRYTGRMVWGRTRGHEVLRDPDDVTRGHRKVQRWTDPADWVMSERVHDALIDDETFAAAQAERAQGQGRRAAKSMPTKRTYVLRGRVFCMTCGRRMEGDTVRHRARYRCRLSSGDYARNAALDADHPRSAQLFESKVLEVLDPWLAGALRPERLAETVRALAAVEPDPAHQARAEAARRQIAECDRRLAAHRKALEAGADAEIVTEWMRETAAVRAVAERDLADATPPPPLSEAELTVAVKALGQVASKLRGADPAGKAKLYAALGVRVYFTPGSAEIEVTVAPPTSQQEGVRGGISVGGGT